MEKGFKIRESVADDDDKIISLVKLCLGDKSIRSVNFWNWKHTKNPYGKSYILLAFDEDKLIGLRTFMKWEWQINNKTYKCVRAVDAATHPDYRRKGLFSLLTESVLDIMKKEGVDFVFNTPNSKSLAGNLKMGWKELGKSNLFVKIGNPFEILYNRIFKKKFDTKNIAIQHRLTEEANILKVMSFFDNQLMANENNLAKPVNLDYFLWRYKDVPVYQYGCYTSDSFILFFRLLKKGRINELRICDLIINKTKNKIEFKKAINQLLKSYRADLATLTVEGNLELETIAKRNGFMNYGNKGLTVVLKTVNQDIDSFLDRKKWAWTSGDLELF